MAQTPPRYDVVAIGNAIVDVLAKADDAFLARHGMTKGSMQLIDAEMAEAIYADMGPGIEISGGSAANTLAGMAALGAKCGFIGQVADDQLGEVFTHDIRAAGIDYITPAASGGPPTARCMILVTPDGQRTMNTFLGASHVLGADAIDAEMIAAGAILYLEGYLWDPEQSRGAMRSAIRVARDNGRKVAFTLSDAFIIDRHRADFLDLIANRQFDILFANEVEIASLQQTGDFEQAVARTAAEVPMLIVTRGEKGAIAVIDDERHEVPAEAINTVVDTTGAGDLFAAGFLAGLAQGRDPHACLVMGAVCAREIIGHVGARPQAQLDELVTERLG